MELAETAIDTTSRVCQTENGYSWYICTWTTPYYSGCCRVDPCREAPPDCPGFAQGYTVPTADLPEETTVTSTTTVQRPTLTITRTASRPDSPSSVNSSSSSSSPTPAPGASAPSSPTISSTPTANNDSSSSNGMTLSVSALVGIGVSCGIVALFAALSACMWWGRRRRRKDEKQKQAERLVISPSRGQGEEHIPSGLESVFNPMTQSGPGSVFDRSEGRMARVDDMLGFSPLAHNIRLSTLSSGAHSSPVSPLTPVSSCGSGLPSSPSELDATPVRGAVAMARQKGGTAEAGPEHAGQEEGEGTPRATLNPTQQERETGTYANSWTVFQNAQL